MTSPTSEARANDLHARVSELIGAAGAEEAARSSAIDAVLPRHRASAVNLAHYLGLRQKDVHHLQLELAEVGLSSLGRCEGHASDTLQRLCAWLSSDLDQALRASAPGTLDAETADSILHHNTSDLLGPRPDRRHVYVMVTAPDASEVTSSWVDTLLDAGADLLRINGAHGTATDWAAICSTFKARASVRGKPGNVIVDLPGPKFRADVLGTEPTIIHLPRNKDRQGRTVQPTLVVLVERYEGGDQIPLPPEWLPRLQVGDRLELLDAGNRKRELLVTKLLGAEVEASCERSLYITSGLALAWRRGEHLVAEGRIGPIPERPRTPRLAVGDTFVVQSDEREGTSPLPTLVFTEPQLLARVKAGDRVVLDDGTLSAIVEEVRPGRIVCKALHALKSSTRLRSGKGIAFPDSEITVAQLSEQDKAALAFALDSADGVGVSFVNSASDVTLIGDLIKQADRPGFGMILKIETRAALHDLPDILFEALKYHPVGLMIARGDLAIELTFERLAEMQEELLWFGEACHLPVVWATQVLDSLAHSGVATRAEVTDAAMSMRAECVMLNKGPYIADATRTLVDIIHKMEAHQYKKRSLYRKLELASLRGAAAPNQ